MLKAFFLTLMIVLVLVIGSHLFFPTLAAVIAGGIIAFTAQAWAILVASVVIFCVAVMLLFILTGTGFLILGIGAFVWTLLAIILFPVIFPIIVPLFIIFLFLSYFFRRQKRKKLEDQK